MLPRASERQKSIYYVAVAAQKGCPGRPRFFGSALHGRCCCRRCRVLPGGPFCRRGPPAGSGAWPSLLPRLRPGLQSHRAVAGERRSAPVAAARSTRCGDRDWEDNEVLGRTCRLQVVSKGMAGKGTKTWELQAPAAASGKEKEDPADKKAARALAKNNKMVLSLATKVLSPVTNAWLQAGATRRQAPRSRPSLSCDRSCQGATGGSQSGAEREEGCQAGEDVGEAGRRRQRPASRPGC